MSDTTRHHVDLFWELLDDILNAVLFVLVGMEVITLHFPLRAGSALRPGSPRSRSRWRRAGSRWGCRSRSRERAFRLPAGAAGVLTWGGLRGGISIALALSIPPGPWRETLIALTYCVVAFSILVQGLTFGRLVRATVRAEPERHTFCPRAGSSAFGRAACARVKIAASRTRRGRRGPEGTDQDFR